MNGVYYAQTRSHVVELWLICLTFFKKSHKASLGNKFQLLSLLFYFVEWRITSKEKWQSPFWLALWILADATCRFHQNLLGLSGLSKRVSGKTAPRPLGLVGFLGVLTKFAGSVQMPNKIDTTFLVAACILCVRALGCFLHVAADVACVFSLPQAVRRYALRLDPFFGTTFGFSHNFLSTYCILHIAQQHHYLMWASQLWTHPGFDAMFPAISAAQATFCWQIENMTPIWLWIRKNAHQGSWYELYKGYTGKTNSKMWWHSAMIWHPNLSKRRCVCRPSSMTSGVILPVTPEKRRGSRWGNRAQHEFNMVQQVFVSREVPMQC